jgi:hypothetical protein
MSSAGEHGRYDDDDEIHPNRPSRKMTWAGLFEPQLSTVRVDIVGLGRYFAALAVSAVDGTPVPPPEPAAAVELVQRASSMSLRASGAIRLNSADLRPGSMG